ncbi:Hypothetical predicted protein [Lecanosticta acicola]|uniref:DUF7730 domain-containing protein n=1 Tax=Lecanosticta acicola TaxID=111012 RepID=A0AAI8YRU8_9PEZI|nr:Hypothetical predicted protein [Lecanosticta acicola]
MIIYRRKEESLPPSTTTFSMDQSTTSPFLALPAELRCQIYEHLLLQGRGHPIGANILRTCKQIYAEGMPMLYGENTFLAHPSLLASLPTFLVGVRPSKIVAPMPVKCERVVGMIRRFYLLVRLDCDPRFTSLQAQESFSGVSNLELEVFQAMYGSCDFSVLRLFEGVRGVGKARVQGSIGDGKYARWLERCMESAEGTEMGFVEDCRAGIQGWDAWAQGNR